MVWWWLLIPAGLIVLMLTAPNNGEMATYDRLAKEMEADDWSIEQGDTSDANVGR